MISTRFVLILYATLIQCLLLQNDLFSQKKLLFRFNADYSLDSPLQTPATTKNVNINERVDDSEELARGTDGWDYSTRNTAYFYKDSSFIRSMDNISMSLFGAVDLSGELWLKPFSQNGTLFCWDDSTSQHGICVFIQNGTITSRCRFVNEVYNLTTPTKPQLNKWVYINWTCAVKNDSIKQSIYFDGILQIERSQSLISTVGFVTLNAPVSLGFSDESNIPVQQFSGEMYAVNLKSYIPENTYLTTHIPGDGSAYFGIVNYHDYPLNSGIKPIDLRITSNPTPVIKTIFVPYLNDEFIPQGITNSHEDEDYQNADSMIYISMYHKTVAGDIRTKRSIIVEIDPGKNCKVRRCFQLRGAQQANHNGGIAFKNGYIYVASSGHIERYQLPDYEGEDSEKYQELTSTYSNLFQVQSKASFMTYFQDSVWVGDYRRAGEATPYLYGYPLNDQGAVLTTVTPKRYRLPLQTQGVAWKIFDGEKYLFISTSGGDAGSKISRCHFTKLSRTAIPEPDTVFNIPAGGEDLSFDVQGNLLNVSESGAKYFQKRSSPWKTFYPFIFIISEDELFRDIQVSSVELAKKTELLPTFQLYQNYPNPFNTHTVIEFYVRESKEIQLQIYNLLGQQIRTLIDRTNEAGHHRVVWDGSDSNNEPVPGGIYFYLIRSGNKFVAKRKMILLK